MDGLGQPPVVGSEAPDGTALNEFGYKQELPRVLRLWTNWALGFAFISPIVGLYTVVALGAQTAGPAWIWTLPIVIVCQLLVAMVYTQLADRWPIAGGIYQWSRRLIGPKYGWWAGWIYIWALVVTLSTVAYSGGMFLGLLLGVTNPSNGERVLLACAVMAVFTTVNAIGLNLLRWVVNIGIACELVASVGIALALITVFREQPVSVLWEADFRPVGVDFWPAFIAALAIAGWVILGFDACGSIAEETRQPRRDVPKAILISLLTVGAVDVLGAIALILASPNLRAVVNGHVEDPVSAAVETGFGAWAAIPFLVVVVTAFLACGIAVQATGVRVLYSFSRDGMVPFSKVWRHVSPRNHSPVNATLLVAALATAAFLYANALPVLVAFATGGYYISFLAPTAALLYVRLRKGSDFESRWSLGRVGLWINAIAAAWLVLELINIAWPRNNDLPWWQNWGVTVGLGLFLMLGCIYFFGARPDRRFTLDSSTVTQTPSEAERWSTATSRL